MVRRRCSKNGPMNENISRKSRRIFVTKRKLKVPVYELQNCKVARDRAWLTRNRCVRCSALKSSHRYYR